MIVEQLDDLPLLGKVIKDLNLVSLYESHFPDHGHWEGISGGQVVLGWLLYILSESDHRLCHVEDWAAGRLNTLAAILEVPDVRRLDFSDDRLARLLDKLSEDANWDAFEQSIGQHIIQVYRPTDTLSKNSSPRVVRSDSFNVPQFRAPGELFRHGYSKQRRDDVPFCKVMVGYIDELSVPLSIDVIKGSGPDYEYYLPTINRIQSILGDPGNLYVADSNMGSISNRAAIHASANYYLCPLNHKQVSKEHLNLYLTQLPCVAKDLPGLFTDIKDKRSSAHFLELAEQISDPLTGEEWQERRILVYSPTYASGLHESFYNRLDEAEEKIKTLVINKSGRRNPTTLQDLHARIGKIVETYKVEDCFNIQCQESKTTVNVHKHKDRPSRAVEKISLALTLIRKEENIKLIASRLGWQIYGSNANKEAFPTAQLVALYRDEYSIEHLFDYFINRDVGLLPVYLKKESRVKALIRLLSIAMKCSMLMQYKVRAALQKREETIGGIYPGNKGRKTSRPTTPMLLRAFKSIAIVCISPENEPTFQMVPLNATQKNILDLMQMPLLYEQVRALLKPVSLLRET